MPFPSIQSSSGPPSPLIFVLGTTASGKTRLSIELASRFRGEVVNCDSLQLWKGIHVLSAAPTSSEVARVPHHLFETQEPFQAGCESKNVRDWTESALALCGEIVGRGNIPFLVGGTHYYALYLLTQLSARGITSYSPLVFFADGKEKLRGRAISRLAGMLTDGLLPEVCRTLALCPEERLQRAARQERLSDGATDGVMQAIGLKEFSGPYLQLRELFRAKGNAVSEPRLESLATLLSDALGILFAHWRSSAEELAASPAPDDEVFAVKLEGGEGLRAGSGSVSGETTQEPAAIGPSLLPQTTPACFSECSQQVEALFTARAPTIPDCVCWRDFQSLLFSYLHALVRVGLSTVRYARSQLKWRGRFAGSGVPLHDVDTSPVTLNPESWGPVIQAAVSACEKHLASPPEFFFQPADDAFQPTTCQVCGVKLLSQSQSDHHFASNRHWKAVAGQKRRERAALEGFERPGKLERK